MAKLNINPLYIGVDVSAETIDIYVLDSKEHKKINNSTASLRRWVKHLSKDSFIILESTGGYEKALRRILAEHNIPCHVAHPNKVVNFARYQGRKAKTDCLDAHILALYGQAEEPEPSIMPTTAQERFKALVIRRKQVVAMIVQEKNRLNKTTPEEIRPSLERSINNLKEEKKNLEKQIKNKIAEDQNLVQKAEILMSMKGVGIITASGIIAELPELGQVNRNEIAALVGVAPYNQDSGKKEGRRRISGGRFNVRNTLYMGALVAVKYNKVMFEYYQNLVKKGKCFKVAIVAVMRKMIITLNQMMWEQKKWKFAE